MGTISVAAKWHGSRRSLRSAGMTVKSCKVGLSILGSLQREVGDLDRIAGWVRVLGMVNSAPGFGRHPAVINGFSDLILAVFGPDVGQHARSAIGVAGLPFNIAVEIEGEVLLK